MQVEVERVTDAAEPLSKGLAFAEIIISHAIAAVASLHPNVVISVVIAEPHDLADDDSEMMSIMHRSSLPREAHRALLEVAVADLRLDDNDNDNDDDGGEDASGG